MVHRVVRPYRPLSTDAVHPDRVDGQRAVGTDVQPQEALRVHNGLSGVQLVEVDVPVARDEQVQADHLGGDEPEHRYVQQRRGHQRPGPRPAYERQMRPRLGTEYAESNVDKAVRDAESPVFTASGPGLWHRERGRPAQDDEAHQRHRYGDEVLLGTLRVRDDVDHAEHEQRVHDTHEGAEAGIAQWQPREDPGRVPLRRRLGREGLLERVLLAGQRLAGQALRRGYVDGVRQAMRAVQVGAAATARHQVPVRPLVVRVVVQVPGEHQLDLRPGRLDDGTDEEGDRVVGARIGIRLHPARRRRAGDDG